MRNRAKCKLCKDIIESYHRHDYVICKCGEISIDGGNDYLKCSANDWINFLRVDDQGNDIIPTIVNAQADENTNTNQDQIKKPTKNELIDMLDEMSKSIENLPHAAMTAPITHYDYQSLILLLSAILKA